MPQIVANAARPETITESKPGFHLVRGNNPGNTKIGGYPYPIATMCCGLTRGSGDTLEIA